MKAPILIPGIDSHLINHMMAKEVAPGYHRLMRRESDALCIFHNGEKCVAYESRPLECRLYPWVLKWTGFEVGLRLDAGCQDPEGSPVPELPEWLDDIPPEWWKGFENLPV